MAAKTELVGLLSSEGVTVSKLLPSQAHTSCTKLHNKKQCIGCRNSATVIP